MLQYLSPPLSVSPTAVKQVFDTFMESSFEGWLPNDANLDDRIGGAISQIAAQLNEAAADGATNIFRFLGANLHQVAPLEAEAATGLATWTATDTLGHTIPAGTVAVFKDGLGNRWGFELLAAATISPGQSSVTGCSMRAIQAGSGADGISGVAVELASPIAYIASVTMTTETSGGAEEESDAEYLARLRQKLELLTPAPILPEDFNKLLTEHSDVGRAYTMRGYSPTATLKPTATLAAASATITALSASTGIIVGSKCEGTGIPANTYVVEIISGTSVKLSNAVEAGKGGSGVTLTFTGLNEQSGCAASWITATNGEAISRPAYETEIQAILLAGVLWKLLTPVYVTVNVEATVVAWPGQNAEAIKAAVESAIAEYVNPERWGLPPTGQSAEFNNDVTVRVANAEAAILRIPGVHYVSSLKLNGSEANLIMSGGVVVLPKLGTKAVTVNLG